MDQSNRISEADLRGALSNPQNASENENDDEGDNSDNEVEIDVDVEEDIVDYQLTRAIDLLEGIALYKKALK